MLLVQAAASEILWNDLMVHLLIYQVSVDLDTSGKMQIFLCSLHYLAVLMLIDH